MLGVRSRVSQGWDQLTLTNSQGSLCYRYKRVREWCVALVKGLIGTMKYGQFQSGMVGRFTEAPFRARGKWKPRALVPPIELITQNNVGIHDKENVLNEYNKIGNYIATVLKNRAGLRPESHVLDVGCGTGRVAIPLTEYLTTGSYTGVDVVKSSIEWCASAFRDFQNFRFVHADLYSEFYNPSASLTAEEYRFPFNREHFDVIWSASLFTHMLMPSVDNYLKEMARVARPGGRIWNSYLLLDDISEPLVLGPRNDGRRMQYKVEGGRVGYQEKPEHVVGLYKDQILGLHEKHGLEIIEVQLSNWSGGRPDTKYRGQEVIIARKS